VIVIDSHLDIAMNAFYLDRDLRKSVAGIREDEAEMTEKGRGNNTLSFPEMRRTEMALCFCTMIARTKSGRKDFIDVRTQEIAYARAQGELAFYREMERQGDIRMITDWPQLDAHMKQWKADPENTPLGMVLTMEGADPIVDLDQLGLWWSDGLRALSLAHYGPSEYAHGTESLGGLTERGKALLEEMNETSLVLDITHLNDQSFWEAVEIFQGPIWASHSNCRALVPGDRQLTDEMIRHIVERDGVIGSALDAWMIVPNWIRGVTTPEVCSMEDYVDHIDHVCQVAGNADHAAIGTDLDGGYGTEQTPRDLETIYALQSVPDRLRARGYSESDIEKIMHGNWLRMLERVWTAEG
jgi:membrane dipeptidase